MVIPNVIWLKSDYKLFSRNCLWKKRKFCKFGTEFLAFSFIFAVLPEITGDGSTVVIMQKNCFYNQFELTENKKNHIQSYNVLLNNNSFWIKNLIFVNRLSNESANEIPIKVVISLYFYCQLDLGWRGLFTKPAHVSVFQTFQTFQKFNFSLGNKDSLCFF